VSISHQTVKNILEDHGVDPAPQRKSKTSWSDFIKSHTNSMLTADFLATEVWTAFGLVTFYVLFFVHVGTRKVYLGGIATNPPMVGCDRPRATSRSPAARSSPDAAI
jgi:putative transposase